MFMFKSVLIVFAATVALFTVIVGGALYFAVQGTISFWWLSLAIPLWIFLEVLVAIYVVSRCQTSASEFVNAFRAMHKKE